MVRRFGTFRAPKKPINLSRFGPARVRAFLPKGFAVLGLGRPVLPEQGPAVWCNGRPEFMGGTVSVSECYIYWALLRLLGPEGDGWAYQQSYQGGRHVPGGAVVDFVIYEDPLTIGVRVQTYFYHFAPGSMKQESDYDQFLALSSPDFLILDVYEQEFIHDPSGQAALWVTHDAINGLQHPSPLASGTVLPV